MDSPNPPPCVNRRFAINEHVAPKSGAMGRVYQATDLKTEEHSSVALKWFHEDQMPEVSQESWNLEVKSLRALKDCENVARLIDFGWCDQTKRRFIATEWVDHTLADFIGDDDYSWDDYYKKIGRPVLKALVFAFKNGIYHRDIKPDNILVTGDKVVNIVDFGIAQFAEYFGARPK